MIFFGYGGKRREFVIDARTRVVVTYHYFHIFFVFTAAWKPSYFVLRLTDEGWAVAPSTKEEATLLNGGVVPDINPWWRFSLLGAAAIGIAAAVFSSMLSA